jgi:hypothetical protein
VFVVLSFLPYIREGKRVGYEELIEYSPHDLIKKNGRI